MGELERMLQARITAQALVIEALLDAVVKARLVEPSELVERLDTFAQAPKSEALNPSAVEAVNLEVGAWADMVFDLYGGASA